MCLVSIPQHHIVIVSSHCLCDISILCYMKCVLPFPALHIGKSCYLPCIFRAQGLNVAAFRACAGLGPFKSPREDKSSNEHRGFTLDRWITSNACQCSVHFPNQSVGIRNLSSQAGAKSGGEEEDDLEEGFSELETPEAPETAVGGVEDSDSSSDSSDSESDLSGVDENSEETLETELLKDAGEAVSKKKLGGLSPLLNLILKESGPSVSDALDKYAAEEKELSRSEVYHATLNLRRRKMFVRALQVLRPSTMFCC